MGYGKSKPGMFKMKHQGVPALLKALTGGQKEMVGKMREQGKTSAADKIEKGILAEPAKKAAAKKTSKKMVGTQGTKESKDAGVTYYADKGQSVEGGPSENQRAPKGDVYAKSHGGSRPSTLSFKEARDFSRTEAAFDRAQKRRAGERGLDVKNRRDQKKLMEERSRRNKS
jgi:hypothetical protein